MPIRPARAHEAETVAEIGRRTYRLHFGSSDEIESWLDAQFDPREIAAEIENDASRYLLCERDDAVCGFAKLRWRRPVPHHDHSGAELQKIYFMPEATGRGLGGATLERCIDDARERGEPAIWLEVVPTNVRAQALYARHGFEARGNTRLQRGTQTLELSLMVLSFAADAGETH